MKHLAPKTLGVLALFALAAAFAVVARTYGDSLLGIRILGNGNVGIGTTEPAADLHVNGDSLTTGIIKGTGGDGGSLGDAAVLRGHGTGGADFDYALAYNSSTQSVEIRDATDSSTLKTFIIPHPVEAEKYLVHATLEGPEGLVYYRGSSRLEGGRAVIELPPYFEALTRREGRTVLLTASGGFDPIAVAVDARGGKVVDGRFTVYSGNPLSSQAFDWEVKAVRADSSPLDAEPLRSDLEVAGLGPYTYGSPRAD